MTSAPKLKAQDAQLDFRMACLAFVQVFVCCETSTIIVRMCTRLLLLLSEYVPYYYCYCQNVFYTTTTIVKVCILLTLR